MAQRAFPPAPPKSHFLLGNVTEFSRDTLSFLLDIRQYGDIASFKFGPFTGYAINHPDFVHQVLVTDSAKVNKSTATKNILDPVLGNGLFTSDGDFWKGQRKLMQPAFHTKRIGAYADAIVHFADQLAAQWGQGSTVEMDDAMTLLTMQIISKTLFDADVNSEASELSSAVTDVLSVVNEKFNSLFPAPYRIPTATHRRFKAAQERLDAIIQKFIDDWRMQGADKGDLLSMIMMARDENDQPMADKQIANEAMTLFGAGHETTANALTWTWYLLSQHPEIEARLLEELDSVLGGRLPTLEDLPNLRYTEQIVKESLRLYPPAWAITREVLEPITIGGYEIPKRGVVMLNMYGIHRDERFFPEPQLFNPDRFTPEREKELHKYAYFPFGGGPRVCIGNAFAMMEAKLILATLAPRFQAALATGQIVEPQRIFTLRPKYGMKMDVRAREGTLELA